MILDFVEYVNKRPPSTAKTPSRRGGGIMSPTMDVDIDGLQTIEFLRKVHKASSRIAGPQPESLGLHPAVYFYSATGAYQPSAFLAAITFVQDLEAKDGLKAFTEHRYAFEELLLKYKYFINQIVRHFGSGSRGLTALTRLFAYLYDGAAHNTEADQLVPVLIEDERLNFLKPIVDGDKGTNTDFSSDRKSAVFLREAIDSAVRCGICKARVHTRSFTIDHIQRKRDGGSATEANGQLAHPFCNSTFKN